MKKIVGIIAALALVSAVFADEPSVATVVSEFKGEAALEWIADLDAETTGMKNSESASFKIKFVTEGTKASEGDGLWGQIEIKAGNWEVAYGAGEAVYAGAVTKDANGNTVAWDAEKKAFVYKDKDGKDITEADFDGNTAVIEYSTKNVLAVPGKPSVEKAIIHFVDDDFYARMNIKAPNLKLGGGDLVLATASPWTNAASAVTLTGAQGFTLEFGVPVVDVALQFADNGQQKSDAKKFGFVLGATLKAVENLEVYGGVGYSTEEEKAAIAARVSYKLGLDNDMYLRPTVGFSLKDKAKELTAGVFFGWGAEGQEPKFAKFNKGNGATNIADKCSDGVSIALKSTLEDKAPMGFLFGVYDNKLLADFGLKVAAQLAVADLANFGKGTDAFDAAVVYSQTFDIWKVDANLGAKFLLDPSKFGMLYGFGVSTDGIIQNTSLYIKYAGEHAKDIGEADYKGTVTLGAKISI